MTTTTIKALVTAAMAILVLTAGLAQAPADIKAKFDTKVKELESLSTDPQVVIAVKSYNSTPPSAEAKAMTNEQWRSLTLLDPFVRSIGKNPLSEYLRTKRDDAVVKIFVSGADGGKVGFDAKTEHWTHKGLPKHEVPMGGQMWIGPVKLDDSTGLQMIQVGLPVLDGGKPIGSVVCGLRTDRLR
jgi:hypothetical protein